MEQKGWAAGEYQAAGKYLVHLIRCGLHGTKAQEKPAQCSWNQVFTLAKNNKVEAVSFFGIETVEQKPPEDLYKEWQSLQTMTLYRQLRFDMEREQILAEMKEAGISYLPLKGVHLAGYYPQPGMRYMADNDILYGYVEKDPDGGWKVQGYSEAQKSLVNIMKRRGYMVKNLNGNHDNYEKPPMYNFEMHRRLMAKSSALYAYYENPWKRAVQCDGESYAFYYTDEDEYIYFLAHAFKHFDNSGCGIRSAVDEYIFLNKKSETMDWQYIGQELEKTGLTEFEKKLRKLAYAAFGEGQKMEAEEERLLYYMLGCGVYGNVSVHTRRGIEKLRADGESVRKAKVKYIWSRVFLSKESCEVSYPFFARHRSLLPVLAVYRMLRGLSVRRKWLWSECKALWR